MTTDQTNSQTSSSPSASSLADHATPNLPAQGVYGAGKITPNAKRKPVSLPRLHAMRKRGEKMAMLTAYDATFAAVADAAGVDLLLVGDSLGMVCQGHNSTTGVSMETMVYHVQSVVRGLVRTQGTAFVVGDMPFGSYHQSKEQALTNAAALMQAGAHMVKLEGGGWTTETVAFLVERGIPVCAHLGLTPQTVHALGGYRVQGRSDEQAAVLKQHALELQDAGARLLVLEMVPAALSAEITDMLPHCHTIGIGAGNGTAGQVLVLHDMLGINLGKMPRFVRNFMEDACTVHDAIAAYAAAVKDGSFPQNDVHAW